MTFRLSSVILIFFVYKPILSFQLKTESIKVYSINQNFETLQDQYQPSAECIDTFNLYGPLYAPNTHKRLKLFIDKINIEDHRCPIIHLQEVWTEAQVKILIKELKKLSFASKLLVRNDFSYKTGLVTLYFGSKKIKSSHEILYLENYRGAADWVRKKSHIIKAYQVIEFDNAFYINTHLHHSSQAIRLSQIYQLNKYIEKLDKSVFISGDFNIEKNSLEYSLMNEIYSNIDSSNDLGIKCTYCSDNPLSWRSDDRQIDFIFYKFLQKDKLSSVYSNVHYKKHKNNYLSDHYSLRSYFNYQHNNLQHRSRKTLIKETLNDPVKLIENSLKIMKKAKINKKIMQIAIDKKNQIKDDL